MMRKNEKTSCCEKCCSNTRNFFCESLYYAFFWFIAWLLFLITCGFFCNKRKKRDQELQTTRL